MSETRSVETSAADIEAAIELGLAQLGVARESVIVEILEEPSRGLLGIGARQARVRLTTAARPRPAQVPPPPTPISAPTPTPEAAASFEKKAPPARRPAPAPEPEPQPETEYEDGDSTLADIAPVSDDELDDDARVGIATLQELLGKMQISANVTVHRAPVAETEGAPWVLQIRGRDLGMLIGRRGETLAALQYVTRLIASRELQRRANIVLDVEGYKTRREEMLRRLAMRMADQAIQLGRTVALEPMPPYERRIVHLALRSNPKVRTESTGEGEHRKVTIIPQRY
ncbi:MAG: KH domain-containing protein [Chloroflexi bacterium]|nr:MAG: KH domain-containing protein [Chloroflexota bacterium]